MCVWGCVCMGVCSDLWQLIHQVVETLVEFSQQSTGWETHVLKEQLRCVLSNRFRPIQCPDVEVFSNKK